MDSHDVPRLPVNGDSGLWQVHRIKAGDPAPATEFPLAVFSARITAADLERIVGNPLRDA